MVLNEDIIKDYESFDKIITEEFQKRKENGYSTDHLLIKNAGKNPNGIEKGLGIFAKKQFEKYELIDISYAIQLEWGFKYHNDKNLKRYSFWAKCECENCKLHGQKGYIALGVGSIINSAESEILSNCDHYINSNLNIIFFIANTVIFPGEEIVTWWGQRYYDAWCTNTN